MPSLDIIVMDEVQEMILQEYLHDQLLQYDNQSGVVDLSGRTDLWYATLQQVGFFADLTTSDYQGLSVILNHAVKKPSE